jgi:hypothetical protein
VGKVGPSISCGFVPLYAFGQESMHEMNGHRALADR